MNEKDVVLFNDTLHDIKTVIAQVKDERDNHHTKLRAMIHSHDEKMDSFISQLMSVIGELNELVEDLMEAGTNG